ncbi:MAG TPA: insulinase family protein [Clostridiaceae bacterium]|nr:insulinase family protein [Clostridiaceae bacterium]
MNIKEKNYSKINETMYCYDHKSGLKAFVIQKKGYSKKYAAFATNYGSINNQFIAPGDKEVTIVPEGIAHFLEHKLFEQKDGNIMDKFSELGANPNAYTGFNQTVYLFSCTNNFSENFKLLLEFVQNPYITEESVEKEKGIIAQEIKMYQDDPGWRSFFNLLGAFYRDNPVRIDIAGTVESISNINRDILYKCYNTFYHPSNMMILVVGDVDPGEVFEQVEKSIKITDYAPEIIRIFPEREKKLNKNFIQQNLQVSTPLFQMGFMDNPDITENIDYLNREVAVKILLEMIMGKSSQLYGNLYNQGLINNTFEFDYSLERNYAFSVIGGESSDPLKVKKIITQEIENLHNKGIDAGSFERVKKSMYGRFIRQFNSIERISHAFISIYFKNVNMFDYLDVYDKISFEYVSKVFKEHFNLDKFALSVINPLS